MILYAGHTQAPTSSVRTFAEKTSHPFRCDKWIVAHNGVLTNLHKLKKLIKDKRSYNEVDSSLIPALLDTFSEKYNRETDVISNVLSELEGTFGVWIYSILSNSMYVARSGSTIYGNFLTNDFSSLPYKNFVPYKEGILYMLTREGTTEVGDFSSNSPFFII